MTLLGYPTISTRIARWRNTTTPLKPIIRRFPQNSYHLAQFHQVIRLKPPRSKKSDWNLKTSSYRRDKICRIALVLKLIMLQHLSHLREERSKKSVSPLNFIKDASSTISFQRSMNPTQPRIGLGSKNSPKDWTTPTDPVATIVLWELQWIRGTTAMMVAQQALWEQALARMKQTISTFSYRYKRSTETQKTPSSRCITKLSQWSLSKSRTIRWNAKWFRLGLTQSPRPGSVNWRDSISYWLKCWLPDER